jgi:hypothetical protein
LGVDAMHQPFGLIVHVGVVQGDVVDVRRVLDAVMGELASDEVKVRLFMK